MCDVDLESCTTFNESVVKSARKDHECDCCGGPIPKGTSYLKHFSVFDGNVTWEKQCPACTTMVAEFTKDHGQHSNPSYMRQLLQDCVSYETGEDDKMAEKWRGELRAMDLRSGQPEEDKDDGQDDDEEDGSEEGSEAGEEAKAGNDQGGQEGLN